ncbi:SubName: Full=Uncharacterized protein {ECO:0000313/EMBL:CCA75549.1} [Serendipita indica DSM 11827]|nr:SubName: Full=Uncharacterized protein {ECO:0000313/EMBL:CCA75549.1} [Serendipita indica DSM 11827]
MSTYEFQISSGSHNYPSDTSDLTLQGPTQTVTPGASNTPQPIIIQYDGTNQKHLYGSGDQVEDGFNLQFATLDAFMEWKQQEEETHCVDYFKVDCHTSKAVPPRFKEHVKFACSRHARAGQKKYVKKYPERQRKTPSKKIEGIGCPSTISYKTYFDTPIVKVNYNGNHSHETGEANRPFTKKFRRENRNNRHKNTATTSPDHNSHPDHNFPSDISTDQNNYQTGDDGPSLPPSPPASMHDTLDLQHVDQTQYPMHSLNYEHAMTSQHTSPSAPNNQHLHPHHPHHHPLRHPQPIQHHGHPPASQHPQHGPHTQQQQQQQQPTPIQDHHRMQMNPSNENFDRTRQHSVAGLSTPNHDVGPPQAVHQIAHYQHRTDQERAHMHPHMTQQPQRVAHPPHLTIHGPQPQPASQHMPLHGPQAQQVSHPPPPPPTGPSLPDRRQLAQERWAKLANMFGHIKRQAETFEFNDASVSALEMASVFTVLC